VWEGEINLLKPDLNWWPKFCFCHTEGATLKYKRSGPCSYITKHIPYKSIPLCCMTRMLIGRTKRCLWQRVWGIYGWFDDAAYWWRKRIKVELHHLYHHTSPPISVIISYTFWDIWIRLHWWTKVENRSRYMNCMKRMTWANIFLQPINT